MTSTELATDTRGARSKKPRDEHNGHKIILKTMINKKQVLVIELLAGFTVKGIISQFDNYTITIMEEVGAKVADGEITISVPPRLRPRTYFKHAIQSFYAE